MTLRSKYIDNRRIGFPSRWMERPKHDWPPINETFQLSFLPMLISITRAILLLHSSGDGITLSLVGGTLDEVVLEWSLAVGAWRLYWLMQLSCVCLCVYTRWLCVCVCVRRKHTHWLPSTTLRGVHTMDFEPSSIKHAKPPIHPLSLGTVPFTKYHVRFLIAIRAVKT